MDAIAKEFQDSGQVFVIDFEKILEYTDSKNPKKEKKSTKEALAAFESGKKAYENLNIQEAITHLEKSKVLYKAALWDENSFEGLRSTKFYLAMAYLADKKDEKAKQELQEMIVLDPRRGQKNPSEKYYSPQIRQLYQKILQELKSSEMGELHIQTTPPKATVFLDGVSQGTTPFDVKDIPIGRHFVRVVPQGDTQGEMIEKSIVEGSNEIDYTFPEVASGDSYSFFQTLGGQKELDQTRATYLDEMGLALGADLFLFLTPLEGKVKGQLYDQRSQELSREVTEVSPPALVSKLLQSLGPDGYVIPGDRAASEQNSESATEATDDQAAGVELKPRSKLSTPHDAKGIDYTQTAEQPSSSGTKAWYQNKWVWIAIGGGLIAAGAGAYAFGLVDFGSSASTVKATIP